MKENIKVTFHYGNEDFEKLIKFIIFNKLKTKKVELQNELQGIDNQEVKVLSAVQETERGEE